MNTDRDNMMISVCSGGTSVSSVSSCSASGLVIVCSPAFERRYSSSSYNLWLYLCFIPVLFL